MEDKDEPIHSQFNLRRSIRGFANEVIHIQHQRITKCREIMEIYQ